MGNILKFDTILTARKYFLNEAAENFERTFKSKNIDFGTLSNLSIEDLQVKIGNINGLLEDTEFINNRTLVYVNKIDFIVSEHPESFSVFKISIRPRLNALLDYAKNRIHQLEEINKLETVKETALALPDNEEKEKLLEGLSELKEKLQIDITTTEQDSLRVIDEITIEERKVKILHDKSEIFLKFIDKESVASIVGAILLLLMGISLIIMMFYEINPIQIVQSAFLLILGYFFGNSKNNK